MITTPILLLGMAAAATPNPIDRILTARGVDLSPGVDDATFARRVHLDLIGLLPDPDRPPDADRDRLIESLLADRRAYADHWLSFWSDALRNAYRGTGFIDNGRAQITGWLYRGLYENKPYDRFVRELIDPVPGSEGFVRGIKWRGVVNESQRPEIQAAQNVAQVFLGTNLKCASCHDSFVNSWKLTDAYSMSSVFADAPLELHRCDAPVGRTVEPGFLYPELGGIEAGAAKGERMRQLAGLVTKPENARFARTMVNRLWASLMGRGIVEPVDDIDAEPFNEELLDFLARDFVEHGYDVKRTLKLIATSRAYQMPTVAVNPGEDYRFRGPSIKRMSAEQFVDAVRSVAGVWPEPGEHDRKPDGRNQGGQLAVIGGVLGVEEVRPLRCSLTDRDDLQAALGRPNREQVVTGRKSKATMLQALELTNGRTLDRIVNVGAGQRSREPDVIRNTYRRALGREPTDAERELARELIGAPPTPEGVADLLWVVVMLPEFQLIR